MSKDKVDVSTKQSSTTDSGVRNVSEMMGPPPETRNGKKFVLMAINYMNQWVGAVANSSIKAIDENGA